MAGTLSIKKGITALFLSLEARCVFQFLMDSWMKGPDDDGEIKVCIGDISSALNIPVESVNGALRDLANNGYLHTLVVDFESNDKILLEGLRLVVSPVVTLFQGGGKSPKPMGEADRRRCGCEIAIIDDGRYTAEVYEAGEHFGLKVDREYGPTPFLVRDDFLTPEEAWKTWDDLCGEHQATKPAEDNVIHLNGSAPDGSPTGVSVPQQAQEEALEAEGQAVGEEVSEERRLEPQTMLFTLSDGSVVKAVYITPWTDECDYFKFEGNINQRGEHIWYARSKDLLADSRTIEEIALAKAEELRAKYLASFSPEMSPLGGGVS